MKRPILLLLGAALCCLAPAAAMARDYDNNGTVWLNYFGDHQIGESPWGLHLDAQVRRDNMGMNQQQYLVQPGVNYQLNERVSLGAGYGYMRTYPYGEFPLPLALPEHRVWEQASIATPCFGHRFTHRFRLEQRHLGTPRTPIVGAPQFGGYRYENRFRYRLLTTFPLPFGKDSGCYLKASDEIFINFGGAVAKNTFDQNRAYLALGRNLRKDMKVELGFMEQTLQHRNGRVIENNHTLMLSVFFQPALKR